MIIKTINCNVASRNIDVDIIDEGVLVVKMRT
jgi:hypothetical protein